MKPTCERCSADLAGEGDAFICSFECTFCEQCALDLASVCPNCSGRLVLRPPRAP